MGPPDLVAWIDHWSGRYDARDDSTLDGLDHGRPFDREEMTRIFRWKYRNLWAGKHVESLKKMPEDRCTELQAKAFSTDDELCRLLILDLIPGLNTAGASAVLMVHDRSRFTVMDRRAIKSLKALGLWGPERSSRANELDWPDYLATCRRIEKDTDRELRTVDRALFRANGSATIGRTMSDEHGTGRRDMQLTAED